MVARKTGAALNKLRNEYGTGHGRESQPDITEHVARYAVRAGLNLSDLFIEALDARPKTG